METSTRNKIETNMPDLTHVSTSDLLRAAKNGGNSLSAAIGLAAKRLEDNETHAALFSSQVAKFSSQVAKFSSQIH